MDAGERDGERAEVAMQSEHPSGIERANSGGRQQQSADRAGEERQPRDDTAGARDVPPGLPSHQLAPVVVCASGACTGVDAWLGAPRESSVAATTTAIPTASTTLTPASTTR